MTLFDLTGRVAVVTGGNGGIGLGMAKGLAAAGAVVVVAARNAEKGKTAAAELASFGVRSAFVALDVADEGSCRALIEATVERFGRLDILINNAGTTVVIPHHEVDKVTIDVWRRILDVNVVGTWSVTVAALPHLRATGAGCVVNVTSIAGVRQVGSSIPYAASKAALNHVTRLLANVTGPEVRINAVAPGLIDTPWTEDWDIIREAVRANSPLRRSGTPEDVAAAVLALVHSPYQTGDVVLVDGGMHLR